MNTKEAIYVAIARLRAIVTECRSSVKFDLLHYEKMARAFGHLGPEGAEIHAASEAEAQRLHELMAKIDALEASNEELTGASSASHMLDTEDSEYQYERYVARVDDRRAMEYAEHRDPNDPDHPGWREEEEG